MKLSQQYPKAGVKGMTLIELTVVILVLLSLISILFVGARAYKRGSDRAGCLMNIRNAQQAARSFANFNDMKVGSSYDFEAEIVGTGNFMELVPTCPGNGSYSFPTELPDVGGLVMTCSLASSAAHVPQDHERW